jgi:hypothetical protein
MVGKHGRLPGKWLMELGRKWEPLQEKSVDGENVSGLQEEGAEDPFSDWGSWFDWYSICVRLLALTTER